MTRLFQRHDIESRFYQSGRILRPTERERFKVLGVDLVDLALPDMVLGSSVVFDGASFLFVDELDCPTDVSPAFVLLCRDDEGNAIDIAAWSPSSARLATWLGRAWAIDQFRVLQPRPSVSGALTVFKCPLAWLRGGREGIVIVDHQNAKWEIAHLGCTLFVQEVSLGQSLRSALTIRPPAIVISSSSIGQVTR
jgi:hypothetical protein